MPIISMCSLLEFCFGRIIYFVSQDQTTQKDLAIKDQLCRNGLIANTNNRAEIEKIYDNLIPVLSEPEDRQFFRSIRDRHFLKMGS